MDKRIYKTIHVHNERLDLRVMRNTKKVEGLSLGILKTVKGECVDHIKLHGMRIHRRNL